jgi:hypothetical protein
MPWILGGKVMKKNYAKPTFAKRGTLDRVTAVITVVSGSTKM